MVGPARRWRRAVVAIAFAGLMAARAATDPAPPAHAASAEARVGAARAQIGVTTAYDPAYVRLAYPGGDVPLDRGVCTDVVIRALRVVGVDLQRAVHDDMSGAFRSYPRDWGLNAPDRNIDHRRVPNLETYFRRHGWAVPANDPVQPGDVLSWRLPDGRPHIGIVSDRRGASGQWAVIHNIGRGAREEDVAGLWRPVGHFRMPRAASAAAPPSR
ncbi:MAG: DUF1287 domain-containing protein [Silanimonas sp.]